MSTVVNKKVKLDLADLDGNAYTLIGAFKRKARKQEWTPTEIKTVIDEAMSGDYDHCLKTLIAHTE